MNKNCFKLYLYFIHNVLQYRRVNAINNFLMMDQRYSLKHKKVSMNISFHHYVFVGLFVFVLPTNDVNCHCRDKYIYHKYYKVGCGLDQVPTKIPADVTILYISHNNIFQITLGAFSSLTNCNELWLANNKLTYISVGMFSGLTSLKKLVLQNWTLMRKLLLISHN